MLTKAAALLALATLAPVVHAAEFEYLGLYSDVSRSSQSQDCGGYDIELWAVRDHAAGSNVAGLFRLVDGDCDKAPRPIFNGRLNRKTGELTFEVPVSESPVLSTGTFKGAMTDRTLAGTLTLANGNTEAGRTQAMTIKIDRKQN